MLIKFLELKWKHNWPIQRSKSINYCNKCFNLGKSAGFFLCVCVENSNDLLFGTVLLDRPKKENLKLNWRWCIKNKQEEWMEMTKTQRTNHPSLRCWEKKGKEIYSKSFFMGMRILRWRYILFIHVYMLG